MFSRRGKNPPIRVGWPGRTEGSPGVGVLSQRKSSASATDTSGPYTDKCQQIGASAEYLDGTLHFDSTEVPASTNQTWRLGGFSSIG